MKEEEHSSDQEEEGAGCEDRGKDFLLEFDGCGDEVLGVGGRGSTIGLVSAVGDGPGENVGGDGVDVARGGGLAADGGSIVAADAEVGDADFEGGGKVFRGGEGDDVNGGDSWGGGDATCKRESQEEDDGDDQDVGSKAKDAARSGLARLTVCCPAGVDARALSGHLAELEPENHDDKACE